MARRLRDIDLERAADDSFAEHLPDLRSRDPQVVFDEAWHHVELMEFKILERRSTATTLYGAMFLPPRFYTAPLIVRAPWIRHELIHAWQWRTLGRVRFLARYAGARGRFSIEMPGFRETFRTKLHLGRTEKQLRDEALTRTTAWNKSYATRRLDQSQLRIESMRLMLDAVDLEP